MSFFSFRRARTSPTKAGAAVATAESVEVVRRRARQRLIGAAVLVLIGVIGFPLLFDSQPRPVPVDIAIDIPSRSAVKPGSPIAGVKPAETAVKLPDPPAITAPAPAAPAPDVPPQASLQGKEEIVSGKPAVVPSAPAAAATAAASASAAPVSKSATAVAPAEPTAKAAKPASDGQRAQELLDGKPAAAARVVVQVGAYAETAKAREVRQKLEKAGFKTYTQVIDTKDGSRTRVRVGPFASRAEAEQAAAKIKALDLPASLLAI